jgi:hypothetical protein
MITGLGEVVEAVESADRYKHEQLATSWPELASALAALIEGTTDRDAPRSWWNTTRQC